MDYEKDMRRKKDKKTCFDHVGRIAGILAGTLVAALALLGGIHLDSKAAFPHDMGEKPVIARTEASGVNVYSDSDLTTVAGSLADYGSEVKITGAEGESLYGEYEGGEGWFAMDSFVDDPDFRHIYATVRAEMTAYTDSSLLEARGTFEKYTGVIAVSRDEDAVQVIYDQKDHYEIGWISEGDFANTLHYDGREKAVLRDGIYHVCCGYADNATGGVKDQFIMQLYEPYDLELIHVKGKKYYIKNTADGKYLSVSNRHPVWKSAKDTVNGRFRLERLKGAFLIQDIRSGSYLAEDVDRNLVLTDSKGRLASHWRIKAAKKIQKNKDPFVITQYDPKWCGTPYGTETMEEGCMGTAGCGILAPVNAVYALTGQYMNVMELADYAVEKEYRIIGSGTDDGIFEAAAKRYGRQYGFAWDGKSGNLEKLKKNLKKGDVAVIHVDGHYVSVTAYSEKKDKYLLLDSNCLPKREDTPYGDWISPERLMEGSLEMQMCYFYKLSKEF